ncbi:MAG: YggS family pyridoxal phosphate-dependent enzyme [Clostridiales bacterium]|nr:YggS family pyridoxal phosphate-dependent enzyme [Clostridiales bacterium]
MNSIAENVKRIQENIASAADRAGRDPAAVRLIGVTKTVGVEQIRALLAAGVTALGENRPQALAEKYEAIGRPDGQAAGQTAEQAIGLQAEWHLIGHLQTNKIKLILDKTVLIHSVDSLHLAETLNRQAALLQKNADILIEINIAGELAKQGAAPQEAAALAEQILPLTHVKMRGFMCVAPYVENPEKNRIYFAKMREIFLDVKEKFGHNIGLDHLSMGMTNDYEIAIEEGATMVRIGTGIFGARI